MRGRRNTDIPQVNDSLPPCRVCGEPGSGFHYGVTTCGACKGFFRRSLVRKEPYVCGKSALCHVGPSTSRRESCPKCRYDKCVAVGMSKHACKVGRYSLLKKSKDMKEVLEHKTAVGKSNAVSNIPVTSVLKSDDLEKETCHPNSRLDSTINEFFSPDICPVAFTNDERMGWNMEFQGREATANRLSHRSPDHSSHGRFYMNDDKHISDDYDETLSMSSCFLGLNCEEKISSEETNTKTLTSNTFESEDYCMSEPCYTVLKSPHRMETAQPPMDFNFRSYPVDPFSQSSTIQHTDMSLVPDIHSSNPYSRQSLNYSDDTQTHCWQARETKASYDLFCPSTHKYTIDQQPSFLTSEHSRHENQYSSLQTNNFIPRSFNRMDWMDYSNEHSVIDVVTPPPRQTNVEFIPPSQEQPVCLPQRSVIQSVGHPTKQILPILSRRLDGLNNDMDASDSNNQMTTKSLNSTSPDSSQCLKRKYDDDDDCHNSPKKHREIEVSQTHSMLELHTLKEKTQLSASESGDDSSPKPKFLLCLNPNMSNYVLSVFERFPFVSYEKGSLGSLLNHCYEINDNFSECMALANSTLDTTNQSPNGDNRVVATLANAYTNGENRLKLVPEYDENKMDELFSALMDCHKRFIKSKLAFMTDMEIQSAQDIFWGLCQFKEMVHGKMKFIDDEKYYSILETTGIDVDKRKEYMLTYIYPMEDYLAKIIKFFRAVPGFADFCLADKITLTKASLPIYYLLSTHRGYDTNKQIALDEETGTATRLSIMQELFLPYEPILIEMNTLVDSLKSLKLSVEEIILLKVIMLTCPEEKGLLKHRDDVTKLHTSYCQCLLNLERKRHGSGAEDRFSQVVGLIYASLKVVHRVKINYTKKVTERLSRLLDKDTGQLFKEAYLDYYLKPPNNLTGCEEMESIVV